MKGHDWINTCLPDELIVEIFRRIDSKSSRDSCSLVCNRWLRLERFTRSSIRIGATGSPDLFVQLLASRFSNVTAVHIDERLSISLPVQLGRRRVTGENSPASALKLHYVNNRNGSSSEDSDFDSLCLSDTGLSALADGFPKLAKLRLIWCSNVTSHGLSSLAWKCANLKALDLQGCYVGDQGLAAVGQCCKQLEDLNLRFCEGLTDKGLVELALGVGKSLKSLGVAACAKITDISMEAVASHCGSLETLSLDSEFIHNQGVLAVAQGCPYLKSLKLQCINLTDDALKAVGVSCLSLELLALYSFQRFTDKGLRAIGKGCKKLKNLTLSDCYFLSDKGLEAIAIGCKELTHLEVNGCHNIGTLGLESVGKSCQHLSELALLYCQRIGDLGLLQVGKGCQFLQALHLVDCSSIGDEAMCGIASGCTNLKKLHIRRCYEVLHLCSCLIFYMKIPFENPDPTWESFSTGLIKRSVKGFGISKRLAGEMVKQEERKSQERAEAATPVVKKSIKGVGISKRLTTLGVNMLHGVSNKFGGTTFSKEDLVTSTEKYF
ncbi:unnamed protein product [Vicia faba]|uniref:F-box domain-containing protein n=1 Tax=Vicia faba TaxID=3906 RepID=A0AAV0Z326_VICFA|nr:unnamed protein product [Vicia faba]